MPDTEKYRIIEKFKPLIKYYLHTKFNCNPMEKTFYQAEIKNNINKRISSFDTQYYLLLNEHRNKKI